MKETCALLNIIQKGTFIRQREVRYPAFARRKNGEYRKIVLISRNSTNRMYILLTVIGLSACGLYPPQIQHICSCFSCTLGKMYNKTRYDAETTDLIA